MESVWKDFALSLRALRKNPGFALLAILALALGIGANTAIFSVVYSLMFRPLPGAANPGELVSVVLTEGKYPYAPSYAAFKDYASLTRVFTGAAGFMITNGQFRIGNEIPERIMPTVVTGHFFDVLGVKMYRGRSFNDVEASQMGAGNVVVLSYRFWQRRFHGSQAVVGSVVRINGNAFTIIGIASKEFRGTDSLIDQAMYIPVTGVDFIYPNFSKNLEKRGAGEFSFIGRLRPGVDLKSAQAAASLLAAQLAKEYPDVHGGQRALVYPEPRTRMEPEAPGYLPAIAFIFMTLVALVLLAACSNVAGLLYARASSRQKELAIRMSLGAGRRRILGQLLTESLMLSFFGGTAGILLAYWVTNLLAGIRIATDLPFDFNFVIDTTVIGYTLVLAVASGLVAGVMPGLRISKTDLASTLKEGGRTSQGGSIRQRLRDGLVVIQVAVSLVLLVCAGLFLQSSIHAVHQDLGIQPQGRLVMAMDTEMLNYDEPRTRTFYRRLIALVRDLPGVQSAALGKYLPIGFRNGREKVFIEGRAKEKNRSDYTVFNVVSPGYFETIGMPVLQGRGFNEGDTPDTKRVAIINEVMAETFWPDRNPLGKRFRFDTEENSPVEVVGIVKTAKYALPAERPTPAFYLPFEQHYSSDTVLHVHTRGNPEQMIAAVRAEVQALDPEMPVWDARTLEEHIRYGKMRLYDIGMWLIGGFGLIALTLSAVGLYGVMAFLVNRQKHDIGVRMALGASQRNVLKTIVMSGMKKTVLGLLLGAPLALLAAASIDYLLVGISPRDPSTLAAASVFLVGVALAASMGPAWRAAKVDPMVVLRSE